MHSPVRPEYPRHTLTRRKLLTALSPGLCGLSNALNTRSVFAQQSPAISLVLVTASSSQVEGLSLGEVRQLFLRSVGSDNKGNKLVPLNHPPGSPEREFFDKRILGMSPEQMVRYWIDQKIRGQQNPPRSVSPPQILARMLERLAGSVSYLRPEHVTANLRAIRIDGLSPDSRNYALAADLSKTQDFGKVLGQGPERKQ